MDTSASLSAGFTRTPLRGWVVALLSRMQQSHFSLMSFSFGMFFPFIREDLGLSPWQAGLLQGVWWVSSALLALPFSVVFSRYRPVPLVLVSLLLSLPFLVLHGMAQTFFVLFLARFCFVVCYVIATPARPLLLQQWIAPSQYALVQAVGLSLHSTLLAITISTSALLIGAVGSWQVAYLVLAGFFTLQTVAWALVVRDRLAPVQGLHQALQAQQETPLRALRVYPQGWLVGATMFALAATWTAVVTFLPAFLLEERGVPLTLSGPLLGFLYYGLIPFSPLGGWLSKQVPNRKLLLWIPALCNVVFGVALTLVSSPWWIMGLLTGIGLIWVVSPILDVLPFEFPGIRPREVAVISSLIRTLMGLGFAIGPMLTGLVAQLSGSLQLGLLTLCLLTGIGVIAGWLYPSSTSAAIDSAGGPLIAEP
jgi:DHA1 family inner membrane transport protein